MLQHRTVAETLCVDVTQGGWQLQCGEIGAAHKLTSTQRVDLQIEGERGDERIAHKGRKTIGVVESVYHIVYALITHSGWYGNGIVIHLTFGNGYLGIVSIALVNGFIVNAIGCKTTRKGC